MLGQFLRRLRVRSRIRTFFHHARTQGLRSALSRTRQFFRKQIVPAAPGTRYSYREDFDEEVLRQEAAALSATPLISVILPVHDIELAWLRRAIDSVLAQIYHRWELCIVDDASSDPRLKQYLDELRDSRIQLRRLDSNTGISGASNSALEMATGDYVALLDHDDELTRDGLLEVAKCLDRGKADLIYSDEDFIDETGEFSDAHFKPDYSPDLLRSHNYITHLLVIRRALVEEIGGFRSPFDGAQDYDLILRAVELAGSVVHIPKVLYHWRRRKGSTAANDLAKPQSLDVPRLDAGRRALEEHLQRNTIAAEVVEGNLPNYYRVRRRIIGTPLVSLLIPFRDLPDILEMCLDSILNNTSYRNFEVIGINNDSQQDRTFELMEHYRRRDERIHFHDFNAPFNYAELNNFGVSKASGEHVVLMNNDIEVLTPYWIEALLEHSQRPEVGAVGAKLYYCSTTKEHASHTIQHAGVIVGIGGFAGHSHRHSHRSAAGYFNRLNVVQNLSAVTAALMMVKRELYQEMFGLDGANFKVALNDVDFCLRLRENGYWNVFTPYCEANHYESLSRGYEDSPENAARFQTEVKYFRERHAALLQRGDPFYNSNLALGSENFAYAPEVCQGS